MEIIEKRWPFIARVIWFNEHPYNVSDCDVVIFRNCKEKINDNDFRIEEFTTAVIDLRRQNLEDIWKNMDKGSCRWAIKKAEREGAEIAISKDFESFYKLYCSFVIEKKLGKPSKIEYFKNGILFFAKLNGDLVSAHAYFCDDRNIRLMAAPSRRIVVNKQLASAIGNINKLMIWEAIKYAKNRRIDTFDFGGIYTGKDTTDPRYGITKFKLSFGGRITTVYHYVKFNSPILRVINSITRKI